MLNVIILAVVLGIAAQVVSEWFKLPAILPLLLFGMIAGPSVLGILDPELLGHGLEVIVHVGVAVILFEGGLSLDMRELSRFGGAIRNLLSLGATITTFGSAAAAHFIVGLPWPTAFLFGAIVMVTGPTVIAPLLRHMVAPSRLKTILTSEGLIIDAIGATVAYLILQGVERTGMPAVELGGDLIKVAAVGSILGFVAGSLGRFAAQSRLLSSEIRNLSVLAILLLAFMIAEHQAPRSGILTSVVMGVRMASGQLPDLAKMKNFKGQLTVFLISLVFVLLAAQLDLDAIYELGWSGLWVVLALIFVIRPLSVFGSIMPSQLGLKERIALGLTAPRGIVAAAVASLSAISLREAGIEGASTLEGLVYLVILVTAAWATLMAVVLPRLLGYVDDPSRRRAVLVGANRLTELIASVIETSGRSVAVVDAVPWRMDRFRASGHKAVVGDARDARSYEEAGLERDNLLVAATTNDELNILVAELAHNEFDVEHPLIALQEPPEDFGTRSRAWIDLLGGRGVSVASWVQRIEAGHVEIVEIGRDPEDVSFLLEDVVRRFPEDVLVLAGWVDDDLTFRIVPDDLPTFDRVTLLVTEGEALEHLRTEVGAEEFGTAVPGPLPEEERRPEDERAEAETGEESEDQG